jgi:hypothetical protein
MFGPYQEVDRVKRPRRAQHLVRRLVRPYAGAVPRYLLAVHLDEEREPMAPDRQRRAHADTGDLNRRLQEAGSLVFAAGLMPADRAEVVDATGGGLRITAGTAVSGPRRLGGFWIIEAPDDERARAWAREASEACNEPVELRPFR